MNILIIGSGGREHALGWKMKESPRTEKLFFAPGNAGTADLGVNLPIGVSDFPALKEMILLHRIDMVVVGPEVPLVEGIHDYLAEVPELKGLKIVGPKKAGAMLEGSKDFAKSFLMQNNIPTARYFTVTQENRDEGIRFLSLLPGPYVLKADGLAAGKGVLIIDNQAEAEQSLIEMLDGKFGEASSRVVIEEFLQGVELSVFVVTDGKDYKILPEAKDYKRIGEGDTGLNTGGMGAISPVPFADASFMALVESKIIRPTIRGLQDRNIDYCGFIFFGLINVEGNPYVIEYNVRLGDPETEAIILRIESDLVDLLAGAADKTLAEKSITIDPRTAVTVMMVSGGYPGSYEKGKMITGFDRIEKSTVFHAGTKIQDGNVVTDGGRVLAVSSLGDNRAEALTVSYRNAGRIGFDRKYYRKDLGFDL